MPASTRLLNTPLQYMHLGFRSEAHFSEIAAGGHTLGILWNNSDGLLLASGRVASFIKSLTRTDNGGGASPDVTPLSSALLALQPPVEHPPTPETPQLAPATLQLPQPGESPVEWLSSAAIDSNAIKAWVLSNGLASREGAAWALFASAMKWEVPASAVPNPEGVEGDASGA